MNHRLDITIIFQKYKINHSSGASRLEVSSHTITNKRTEKLYTNYFYKKLR